MCDGGLGAAAASPFPEVLPARQAPLRVHQTARQGSEHILHSSLFQLILFMNLITGISGGCDDAGQR